MLISKTVEAKVGSKTFNHFKNLGYNIKNGDVILVPIEHLNLGSHTKIEVMCDICQYTKFIKYQDYISNVNQYNIYTCSAKCSVKKRELTHLKLYGVSNASKSNKIKEKKKNTTFLNYGVDNPSQSDVIKQTKKETTLKNYGVDNPLKNKNISNKVKNTNIIRYGGPTPLFSQIVKNKSIKTSIKRYGVNNAMQNEVIFSRNKASGFKQKSYLLPSGKEVKIQGYENKALDLLLKTYSEIDILVNDKEIEKRIGEIWYKDENNKQHRYFPDIFIISENKIIEVKSDWIYNKNKKINILKQKSCLDTGFKFEFMILNKKGELLSI